MSPNLTNISNLVKSPINFEESYFLSENFSKHPNPSLSAEILIFDGMFGYIANNANGINEMADSSCYVKNGGRRGESSNPNHSYLNSPL